MDRALSGATTPGQSGSGRNGNEGVLHIPQAPSITGTSPSDCFVSYLGQSLGRGVLTVPADWGKNKYISKVIHDLGLYDI